MCIRQQKPVPEEVSVPVPIKQEPKKATAGGLGLSWSFGSTDTSSSGNSPFGANSSIMDLLNKMETKTAAPKAVTSCPKSEEKGSDQDSPLLTEGIPITDSSRIHVDELFLDVFQAIQYDLGIR